MISPTSCAPNSELLSESGMVGGSTTRSCLPGLARLSGAGLGTGDGLIRGKRFDALPAGMMVEVPGTPTSGTDPTGRLVPRL